MSTTKDEARRDGEGCRELLDMYYMLSHNLRRIDALPRPVPNSVYDMSTWITLSDYTKTIYSGDAIEYD